MHTIFDAVFVHASLPKAAIDTCYFICITVQFRKVVCVHTHADTAVCCHESDTDLCPTGLLQHQTERLLRCICEPFLVHLLFIPSVSIHIYRLFSRDQYLFTYGHQCALLLHTALPGVCMCVTYCTVSPPSSLYPSCAYTYIQDSSNFPDHDSIRCHS